MRKQGVAALAAVATLAVPVMAHAGTGQKVTGGGQILLSTDAKGAGSTIAFTAQGTAEGAKGQVQYIDRSAGGKEKFHGSVTCLDVQGTYGVIGGTLTKGATEDAPYFVVRVVDNGQGGGDMVEFNASGDAPACDAGDDNQPEMALGRGNAQVRDDASGAPSSKAMSFSRALTLAGLG
jgi:hypothetical protein